MWLLANERRVREKRGTVSFMHRSEKVYFTRFLGKSFRHLVRKVPDPPAKATMVTGPCKGLIGVGLRGSPEHEWPS